MLIFDGECGFCTRSAEFAARILPAGARVVPWQEIRPRLSDLGLTEEDVRREVYWVDASGRSYAGDEAVARALRACRGIWPLAGRILGSRPFNPIAKRVYRAVARNRGRLPGGTPACRASG